MATLKLICREFKPLKDGSLPIVIRLQHLNYPVNYLRVKGLYATSIDNWDKGLSRFNKKRRNYKELNMLLTEIEIKADNILSKLLAINNFSYQKFKDLYLGSNVSDLVYDAFDQKITELTKLKKHGTAESYFASRNAIEKFVNNHTLVFSDIDYRWLKKFETHLRYIGNCGNTISYKIRPLRALHYNYCNNINAPLPTSYGKFKVGRLSTVTLKRALSLNELKKLSEYEPVSKGELAAKEIFMFSLFTRGMNIADISLLQQSNIAGSDIIYERSKTGKVFVISITPEISKIIVNQEVGKYLFPIIKDNHKNTKYSVRLFTKYVNNNLQRIAKKIGIPNLTTYYARYTFAALARNNGASTELISQALGHSDLKTTEIYLKSFANSELDNISRKIMESLYQRIS